jgi:transposase
LAENRNEGDNPLDGCSEAVLYNYGYLAYRYLWKELGIEECLEEVQCGSKITYALPETVFLMALQHLLEPMSKRQTHGHQNRYFRIPETNLHHMYRALDMLSKAKEDIEAGLFDYNYVRLNKKVDVVFYDVTTIHFESVIADELRDFGFSKNGKFNEVQVVLGMIIDGSGIPVGYELFKGNTFDGKTMVKALENIKNRFGINRIIIIADRGLNSKGNLGLIKEAGYGYIMAAKLKGVSAVLQEKALADDGFTDVMDKEGNLELRYKIIAHENVFTDENKVSHTLFENMVVSYSPKRGKKDAADRERLIEKAKRLIEKPEQLKASNKRGGKKYVEQTGKDKSTYILANDKIEQDKRFDGYYAIQTSEKTMNATAIMEAYHRLWKIEESFRIMKTTLELRPVYHSKPSRIEGHFVVCFLAFLMERQMELLLTNIEEDTATVNRIRDALNSMQLAAITTTHGENYIKTRPHPLGPKIFNRLKLEMPDTINTKNALIDRFKLDTETLPTQLSFF